MKKKTFGIISIMVLSVIVSACFSNAAFASGDAIQIYRDELEQMNVEMGTNYQIISEQDCNEIDMTYDEVIEFYQDMTLEEFRTYIIQLHNQGVAVDQKEPAISYEGSENNTMMRSGSMVANYFHIQDNTITVFTNNIKINGISYFQSYIRTTCVPYSYPCYVPYSTSYTPSSDSTKLTCSFKCEKYLSETVRDATIYTLSTTFTAQYGGSVTGNTFSSSGVVNASGVRLRNYPNTSSSVLELMYAPENVSIDLDNSTMTFYRARRNSTGTIGYVSKDYVSLTQLASLQY